MNGKTQNSTITTKGDPCKNLGDKWTPETIRTLVDQDKGVLDPRIYSDQELYEIELEQVFRRSWLLLGHETHIPKAGDFLATYMGEDPVVMVRQRNGSISHYVLYFEQRERKGCTNEWKSAK